MTRTGIPTVSMERWQWRREHCLMAGVTWGQLRSVMTSLEAEEWLAEEAALAQEVAQ